MFTATLFNNIYLMVGAAVTERLYLLGATPLCLEMASDSKSWMTEFVIIIKVMSFREVVMRNDIKDIYVSSFLQCS